MFDYQTSKHSHFDTACRAFVHSNNLEEVAELMSMRSQVLRNKLNPGQPHRLTVDELISITDFTEDSRLLDGVLAQLNCLPSVPVSNAMASNIQICALSVTADVGAIAGETISLERMTVSRKNAILDRANEAIRNLSILAYAVEARFQSAPVFAAAVDIVVSNATGLM